MLTYANVYKSAADHAVELCAEMKARKLKKKNQRPAMQ
jgi:hypothetical protein